MNHKKDELSVDYLKGNINQNTFKDAKDILKRIYDKKNGGFGSSPKFPMPQYLLYLLNYSELNDDKQALEIAENTLLKMYKGGIFDHIGYGFFRYSVDEYWLVPHFEKMLYDNALMSLVYTKAYEITKDSFYKEVVDKIYEFVIRDMLQENGGFYSALDADSEGVEGKFYLFESEEIINFLGYERGLLFNKYYDISKAGNFEESNIPNLINTKLEDIDDKDKSSINSIIQMLFTYREMRVKPHRDEKILTSWNGLMIGSLAYAGMVLEKEFYIKKAKESADFLINNFIDKDGNLLSTHISGDSYNFGYLEDYSFLIYGLLNLYKATDEDKYIKLAQKLTDDMLLQFGDLKDKGLFFYGNKSEKLILRPKEFYDGAIPSGNGFVIVDLMKLFFLTRDEGYLNQAKEIFHSFGGSINDSPLAHLYSLVAINDFI